MVCADRGEEDANGGKVVSVSGKTVRRPTERSVQAVEGSDGALYLGSWKP